MMMTGVARVAALLVLLLLLGSVVLAAPEIESGVGGTSVAPAAARRFHAKFVVDRVAPRRTQSTAINPAAIDATPPAGAVGLPSVAKIRSTTRCREGCLQKRSIKDILCTQQRECSMCWDVCNRNHQLRKENELAHRLLLSLVRLIRNESVVTADIEWTTPEELVQHQPHPAGVPSPLAASENVERLSRIARDGSGQPAGSGAVSRIMQTLAAAQPEVGGHAPVGAGAGPGQEYHQCLVSWEISGGGLTGNLLTETSKVELSLWPNTKYHVHVTCRNKETDALIRSSSLLVDTSEAATVSLQGTSTTSTSTTSEPPPPPLAPPNVVNSAVRSSDSDAPELAAAAVDEELRAFAGRQGQRRPHSFWPFDRSDGGGGGGGELPGATPNSSKEVVILGVFVALLALVLIALTVVMLVRRKPGLLEDRELLIESEVLPKILHV